MQVSPRGHRRHTCVPRPPLRARPALAALHTRATLPSPAPLSPGLRRGASWSGTRRCETSVTALATRWVGLQGCGWLGRLPQVATRAEAELAAGGAWGAARCRCSLFYIVRPSPLPAPAPVHRRPDPPPPPLPPQHYIATLLGGVHGLHGELQCNSGRLDVPGATPGGASATDWSGGTESGHPKEYGCAGPAGGARVWRAVCPMAWRGCGPAAGAAA